MARSAIDPQVAKRFGLPARGVAWPTVGLLLAAASGQAASTMLALNGLLPVWGSVVLNALCAYVQFTVAHDAAHKAVSRIGWLNETVGTLAALFLFAPFAAFRRIHLHHHANTNDPAEDPDFWVVGKTWPGTLLRFLTTWPHYYRVYFTRLASLDAALAQSVAVLAAFAVATSWSVRTGHLRELLLYWFLPAQLAVTLLAFLFDYLPHRPHTERGRVKDTAILESRILDGPFLEQNLHLLHHLFPTIPWYRYRPAYESIAEGIRAEGGAIRDLRTVWRSLPPRLSRGLTWGRSER